MKAKYYMILLLIPLSYQGFSQSAISLGEAINLAVKNNPSIKASELSLMQANQMTHTAADFGKTTVTWVNGQYNSINTDNNFTITQSIPFPTVLLGQGKLLRAEAELAEAEHHIFQLEIVLETKRVYTQLAYRLSLRELLTTQDSIFGNFNKASQRRYAAGESTLLEKATAETQWLQVQNNFRQNESDIVSLQRQLQLLLNSASPPEVEWTNYRLPRPESTDISRNARLIYSRQQVLVAQRQRALEKNRILPDINFGVFTQSLTGFQFVDSQEVYYGKEKQFTGFQLGLSFPLWFIPQQNRIKSLAYQEKAAQQKLQYQESTAIAQLSQAQWQLDKHEKSISYFESSALPNADLIASNAEKSYAAGEIGYVEYLNALKQIFEIRYAYQTAISQYNTAVIELERIIGIDLQ